MEDSSCREGKVAKERERKNNKKARACRYRDHENSHQQRPPYKRQRISPITEVHPKPENISSSSIQHRDEDVEKNEKELHSETQMLNTTQGCWLG